MEVVFKLYVHSDAESPREWDNLGVIAAKNFVADERIGDPIDWLSGKLNYSETYVEKLASELGAAYYSNEVREELESRFLNKFIGKPLYKYEHGNVALATTPFNCRWDSGQIGYLYTTKEAIRENWSIKRVTEKYKARALDILEGELDTFEVWCRGEVYGFSIEDLEENHLDACGGFYGDDWDTNGMLDHIDYKGYDLTREEALEILKETKIEY